MATADGRPSSLSAASTSASALLCDYLLELRS